MLDDSDLDFAILSGPSGGGGGGGCLIAIIWLIIVIVIALFVMDNHDKCGKMKCPEGQVPKLLSHECLCVTKAAK